MCTGVIRVVYAKDSPTFSVRSFTGIDFSLSFSLEFTCTTGPKLPEWRNGRESCEELGHTIVLGLPSVHPNTSKQRVAHFYPLQALIPTLWGPQTDSPRPPVCLHSRSHDQSVVNNILELVLQIHHPLHSEYTSYMTGHMT